jgi:hypothetical protein
MFSSTRLPHFEQYGIEFFSSYSFGCLDYLRYHFQYTCAKGISGFIEEIIRRDDSLQDPGSKTKGFKHAESLFSALYIGTIFISLGVIYFIHLPKNLFLELIDFFDSLTLARVPDTGIYLPAPISPAAHVDLYTAIFQFFLVIAVIEVVILALRFVFNSSIKRKAETISNVVFWFGVSYLIYTYLMDSATINKWFVFWIGMIIIFGLSLIARAFVLLAVRQPEPTKEQKQEQKSEG